MTKLVVYWKKLSVVEANGQVARKYKRQAMRTDFDETVRPDEAIESILAEHGHRPEQANPFKIIAHAHSFAVPVDWKLVNVGEREREAVIGYEQDEMIFDEELSQEGADK